ncbi:MAG: hypothetical protein Q7N87_00900 [Candidatus Uhrbacteria bacterium]|nr:hypothetical protein [Candidatus Uhrbacteria bacterium]
MPKPIELEIRGEIRAKNIPAIGQRLRALGFREIEETRRTSVMSFGDVSPFESLHDRTQTQVDIRCRITNGKAEVVGKIGKTHAANRLEISQPVTRDELFAFARLFGSMGFFTKVGSKVTKNFQKGSVIASLVKSPSGLAYIEIEKMTDRKREKRDLKKLQALAKQLSIKLWKSRKEFLDFCRLLTERDDWEFHGTPKDIERLKKEIKKAGSGRR